MSFLSSEDAVRFDRYLTEVGGDALRPPEASCEFCSTIEDVGERPWCPSHVALACYHSASAVQCHRNDATAPSLPLPLFCCSAL